MIRNAGWTDLVRILATRRWQQILRLNPPYTIIQPEVLLIDLLRAQSPAARRRSHTLVYVEGGDLLAYLQARARWQRRDEWTITTLATTERDGEALWRCSSTSGATGRRTGHHPRLYQAGRG